MTKETHQVDKLKYTIIGMHLSILKASVQFLSGENLGIAMKNDKFYYDNDYAVIATFRGHIEPSTLPHLI